MYIRKYDLVYKFFLIMATLVLLWGNSIRNKQRIQEVNQELLPFYDTTHIHTYHHRDVWEGNMDLDYECEKLCGYLKNIKWSIILFCKSLWCLLWLKAIVEKEIFIKQSIFVWFPLGFTELHSFPLKQYLKELTCPVLWIQKTYDPVWWYMTITEQLWSISPAFICKEISGDTHDYPEIKVLKQIILDNNAT